MDKETVKAIEMRGVVHNASKLSVADGQMEDLVNLRFKDGSWRTTGDGRHVFTMGKIVGDVAGTTEQYSQLYVHTNVYRHILGVRDGSLWWFGDISAEGVFSAREVALEIAKVKGDLYLCQTGHLLTIIDEAGFQYAMYKTSAGDYVLLNPDTNGEQSDRGYYPFGQIHFNYTPAEGDGDGVITVDKTGEDGWAEWENPFELNNNVVVGFGGIKTRLTDYVPGESLDDCYKTLHNEMVSIYGRMREKNHFTDPFLVCAAIKLYDGSYLYASAPTLIFPYQQTYNTAKNGGARSVVRDGANKHYTGDRYEYDKIVMDDLGAVPNGFIRDFSVEKKIERFRPGGPYDYEGSVHGWPKDTNVYITNEKGVISVSTIQQDVSQGDHARQGGDDVFGAFRNGMCYGEAYVFQPGGSLVSVIPGSPWKRAWHFQVRGADLCVSIEQGLIDTITENNDIFKSLCIFVTPQSSVYEMDKDEDDIENPYGHTNLSCDAGFVGTIKAYPGGAGSGTDCSVHVNVANQVYCPNRRTDEAIYDELLHSQFYLLKEYDVNELQILLNNPVVDLSAYEDTNILRDITTQEVLQVESSGRYTYIPQVQYNYNGRLHIANYKQYQFHGYPLDTFHLHNHCLRYKYGSWYKHTLRNLEGYHDETLSAPREEITAIVGEASASDKQLVEQLVSEREAVYAYVETSIETSNGVQVVSRYIPLALQRTFADGTEGVDFIESLNPILSFPDNRAKKMRIRLCRFDFNTDSHADENARTWLDYDATYELTIHLYLNMAYYRHWNAGSILQPLLPQPGQAVDIDSSRDFLFETEAMPERPTEQNVEEVISNGLKVSSTNNPLYFPVETTYQVGSSEIVAMMSNAVAVGTGQTGAAPLYVFCKDGVYAMFVDTSGEMAYQNSRIIARDVCNNAKSVTAVDNGVVFTTDRGLMEMVGEQVQELGQPLEGDWVQFTTKGNKDYSLVARNAFFHKQIGGFAEDDIGNNDAMTHTDFLTYLRGAIIDYNHNEYELIVSNPEYYYSYVLDKRGDWSRRDIHASEFVNNYPTSYRVDNGRWYQVDEESDKENGFFAMSHVVKLDSVGFKGMHRIVARGYFETESKKYYIQKETPGEEAGDKYEQAIVVSGWSTVSSLTEYSRTIREVLYSQSIGTANYERTLNIHFGEMNVNGTDVVLRCVEGCEIDTSADNYARVVLRVLRKGRDGRTSTEVWKHSWEATAIEAEGITIGGVGSFASRSAREARNGIYYAADGNGHIVTLTLEAEVKMHIPQEEEKPLAEFDFGVDSVASTSEMIAMANVQSNYNGWGIPGVGMSISPTYNFTDSHKTYLPDPEKSDGDLILRERVRELVIQKGEYAKVRFTVPAALGVTANSTVIYGSVQQTRYLGNLPLTSITNPGSVSLSFGGMTIQYANQTRYAGTLYEDVTWTEDETTYRTSYVKTNNLTFQKLSTDINNNTTYEVELPAGTYRLKANGSVVASNNRLGDGALARYVTLTFGMPNITFHCAVYKDARGKAELSAADNSSSIQFANGEVSGRVDLLNGYTYEDGTQSYPYYFDSAQRSILIHGEEGDGVVFNDPPEGLVTPTGEDDKVSFTIADGYTGTLNLKMHGSDDGLDVSLQSSGTSSSFVPDEARSNEAGTCRFMLLRQDKTGIMDIAPYYELVGEDAYTLPNQYDGTTISVTLESGTYYLAFRIDGRVQWYKSSDKTDFEKAKFNMSVGMTIEGSIIALTKPLNTAYKYGMGVTYKQGKGDEAVEVDTAGTLYLSYKGMTPPTWVDVLDESRSVIAVVGLYVFGSYDGRKWVCLGHREKRGTFTDIGALVERTDCRFFRFVLAGQVSKDSRLDYFEVSSLASKLSGKIR